jgi:hypothetical protein
VELFFIFALAAACWWAKGRFHQQRIALLSRYLSRHTIEKHIETVTQGYLRALGEADAGRRDQVLQLLQTSEQALCRQVSQLAGDFAAVDAAAARVSRLPVWMPGAQAWAPGFDMREALRVHAQGICQAVEAPAGTQPRDRAFAISAELLLMQHTCHWFCRSKWVASARMLARHQTAYEQLVGAVLPTTRAAYLRLVAPGSA